MKAVEIWMVAAIRITESFFIEDIIVGSQEMWVFLNLDDPEKMKISRQKGLWGNVQKQLRMCLNGTSSCWR